MFKTFRKHLKCYVRKFLRFNWKSMKLKPSIWKIALPESLPFSARTVVPLLQIISDWRPHLVLLAWNTVRHNKINIRLARSNLHQWRHSNKKQQETSSIHPQCPLFCCRNKNISIHQHAEFWCKWHNFITTLSG